MNNELNQTGGDHEASGAGQRGRWAAWSEVIEEAFKSAQGLATPWFWSMIYGTALGLAIGVAARGPWFSWLPVGWAIALALGASFKTSEDSGSSEEAERVAGTASWHRPPFVGSPSHPAHFCQ